MIIIFTSYHSLQIPFQGTCTSTCIWNIYGIAYILPPLPWSWTRLVNTCKHHHKPFNFVTSNCTPETCGQCEVYVFLSRSLDFMHLWLFQTLVCGLYRGCRDSGNERNMADSAFLRTVFSFKYSHNNSLVCLWNHQKVIEFSDWPKWRNNWGICNTIDKYNMKQGSPKITNTCTGLQSYMYQVH